ncbi:hypothetical protein CC85DRAFT_323303 [Cutaneotrichosporon oleaginosum]|uniref:Uncharacterized protein n=1 Tax=Cutaneotrichosporon oleaginosum TaxID=879819 RepID=A0A0J1AWJ4_9TREE|nr:uncharacterized protein CC85DRAFT_323303 [Cutaneotrichosporon oleaginosum]KLT39664.1 hypothetical protein CC85DRAFT_323303 [Cutaneotrichosporon oleaginosum]TXT07029.1 hypothetical protein COLE_06360 [Cutaneotrichosporon oleaginosum]
MTPISKRDGGNTAPRVPVSSQPRARTGPSEPVQSAGENTAQTKGKQDSKAAMLAKIKILENDIKVLAAEKNNTQQALDDANEQIKGLQTDKKNTQQALEAAKQRIKDLEDSFLAAVARVEASYQENAEAVEEKYQDQLEEAYRLGFNAGLSQTKKPHNGNNASKCLVCGTRVVDHMPFTCQHVSTCQKCEGQAQKCPFEGCDQEERRAFDGRKVIFPPLPPPPADEEPKVKGKKPKRH